MCLGQLEAGTVHADGHGEHGPPGPGDAEEGRQTGPGGQGACMSPILYILPHLNVMVNM